MYLGRGTLSVCDLAPFTLFISSVFFTHAVFKMPTTLLKHASWENDFNNVIGIDDINRINRVRLHMDGGV